MLQRDQDTNKPTQRLSAWLRHGPVYGVPIWVMVLCAIAVLSTGLKIHAYLNLEHALDDRDAAAAQFQLLTQDVATAKQQSDIAGELPSKPNTTAITRKIQKQALAHKITLSALSIQNHAANSQNLANTEWAVSLRGTYPNIKSALAELMASAPTLQIQSVKFSKTSAYEVEAQAILVEWLAPPSSGATQP